MILPIYAGSSESRARCSRRRRTSAASRCGRSGRSRCRSPFPAVVAGSIFTFSLTLGDYILPGLIANEQFIGTVIYSDRGLQLPLAAAFAMVPVAVMTVYLWGAKRLGAFESL